MQPRKDNRRDNRRDKPEEEKQFDERVISIDRVARVVKGGRRFRFRALVVVGDRKGRLGIGIAKGADVTTAVSKATDVAKKHMIEIVNYKGSIPHEVQAKVGGSNILIKPASAGTGLIAGGVVRTILEVGGISNALSKSLGSTNKVNTAYATLEALQQLVPAKDWVVKPAKSVKPATKTVVEAKLEKAAPAAKPAAKAEPKAKPAAKKAVKAEK
jgi:small subunit ribosomal protein S5